jgi:AraC-like DNA-binding protein
LYNLPNTKYPLCAVHRPSRVTSMRKMNTSNDALARRMEADRAELGERIAWALPHDGTIEPQPGLRFRRHSGPTQRNLSVSEPCFCVIAQGSKDILLGEHRFQYDRAHYLISTMELPLTGAVVEATPKEPYLSFRLVLDPAVVTSTMVESGLMHPRSENGVKAVDVSALDADLLNATLRIVRLIDNPADYRVLSPLVEREIIYRLLTGTQGSRMRHLATFGGRAHRMARAVQKLRENFDKPLRMEYIARELGMSLSGFHAHFKAVTAMSPLQFQKQIRLQEARRLMISENFDAAEAGYKVGYDDASHFSRDYKRHFGEPPMRDVDRIRETAVAS